MHIVACRPRRATAADGAAGACSAYVCPCARAATIERVVSIAQSALVPPQPHLVVFTDERHDLSYERMLLAALSAAVPTGTRVELGEPLMLELASALDPSKVASGKDNFLVFAAELEVYRRAADSLHVCTACPRGGAEECTTAMGRLRSEPPPRATGLMAEWVHGGTG
jgi:hypothetical protein